MGGMNVYETNFILCEEICEIESIARAVAGFSGCPVFALVLLDQVARRSTGIFRVFFRDSQGFLRWCVMIGGTPGRNMFVQHTGHRWLNRSDRHYYAVPSQP